MEAWRSSPETRRVDAPWSCRLVFRSGQSLVIALGELGRQGITYIPDTLVVTATREVAESYRPIRAWDHAWGSDEPPSM